MTEEEITKAAWREMLTGAEGAWVDWIDEEDEYGEDWRKVFYRQGELIKELKAAHQ